MSSIFKMRNENGEWVKLLTEEDSIDKTGLPYLTEAPIEANENGIKIVVLDEEPEVKYDGYMYIIKEA